ncbi:pimelyl-ACP methyl ester esterase BioV [Sulfurimonas sp. HSL-1716]|uniref:pimelyl-ACP methyl ester esterase BioV n=1 Tax=Hydrocurvibacter sulfurireducens TaxID=3131937 RepID=UPI0031F8AA59
MVYYSGFSLKDDVSFFKQYIKEGIYTVAGFSYGAIKAFEYTMSCKDRVDTLQLFSPAFFQTKPESFKRAQLMAYKKNKEVYLSHFIKGCFEPHELKKTQHILTKESELKELLEYEWDSSKLQEIVHSGVHVEVYLGSEDRIIDVQGANEFFKEYATTYLIKGANHFLQTK